MVLSVIEKSAKIVGTRFNSVQRANLTLGIECTVDLERLIKPRDTLCILPFLRLYGSSKRSRHMVDNGTTSSSDPGVKV